jgi:predicted acyltransferase
MENSFFKKRLLSLDVFRGATIAAMILVNNPGDWGHVFPPLLHAEWHGWTFTDLIFPFFLFIVGVAIVFALSGKLEKQVPHKSLYGKIIRRTLILFALGLFLNGFPYFNLSSLRVVGVLQRIAVCYFVASIIFIHFRIRGQILFGSALLLLYWAMMELIPVPGIGAGLYERGANFSNYIDSILLKGHMWSQTKTWDPEGIISTLPAIGTTMFGVITGHVLRGNRTPQEKTIWMMITGTLALLAGAVWDIWLPVNKNIWTSSYTVLMAGLSLLCLGILYYYIDVKGNDKGTQPFLVYGTNAITVFVLSGIVAKLTWIIKWTGADGDTVTLKSWIYETLYHSWLPDYWASFAYAAGYIFFFYLLMLILYKKRIFIKI